MSTDLETASTTKHQKVYDLLSVEGQDEYNSTLLRKLCNEPIIVKYFATRGQTELEYLALLKDSFGPHNVGVYTHGVLQAIENRDIMSQVIESIEKLAGIGTTTFVDVSKIRLELNRKSVQEERFRKLAMAYQSGTKVPTNMIYAS